MKSTLEELLAIYNDRPSTGKVIIFGKGKQAQIDAESFVAHATEHGAKAIVILDERNKYMVAESDGREKSHH